MRTIPAFYKETLLQRIKIVYVQIRKQHFIDDVCVQSAFLDLPSFGTANTEYVKAIDVYMRNETVEELHVYDKKDQSSILKSNLDTCKVIFA